LQFWGKNKQFKTVCKDDSGDIAALKQQTAHRQFAIEIFHIFCQKGDKAHLDMFRKAFWRGLCCQTFSTGDLIIGDKNAILLQ